MAFSIFPGKSSFPTQNHFFSKKKLVYLLKTIFSEGKELGFHQNHFFVGEISFLCKKANYFYAKTMFW